MEAADLLVDAVERIRAHVHDLADLGPDAFQRSTSEGANTIGWLVWHATRVEDSHVSQLVGSEQIWATGHHAAAQHRDPDPHDTGYGHSPTEAAGVRIVDPAALVTYHDAVAARTLDHLRSLDLDDLDRVVDDSYDPPVTAGVRLMSVVEDCFMHLGQAQYLRGLLGE